MKFNAQEVTSEYDEYGILVTYFGSDSNYVMIQYQKDYDEQDAALGMNTYHIERDDQSYGGYGGVKSWALHTGSLIIELNETGKKNLGTDKIEIEFTIDETLLEKLRKNLNFSLKDSHSEKE